jgi:hypothetical protein
MKTPQRNNTAAVTPSIAKTIALKLETMNPLMSI